MIYQGSCVFRIPYVGIYGGK